MLTKLLANYLSYWAKRYLNRVKPKIIGITGSVGKTSAKEAIFSVLKVKYGTKVAKSEGNLNTEIGMPLAILGFNKAPKNIFDWLQVALKAPSRAVSYKSFDILVLEMAADKIGDIKHLTSIARPDIAVLTAIGPSHLAAFKTIENIIEEKTNILRALSVNGTAVLNIEDDNVRKVSYGGRYNKITYSIDQNSDILAQDIQTKVENFQGFTTFKLKSDTHNIEIKLKTLGKAANVLAALCAASVGLLEHMTAQDIKKGLENIESQAHRMKVEKGKGGFIIIDDCYNANPVSMEHALETLKSLKGAKKYALLGDMREIGVISDSAHKKIGQLAKDIAAEVVTVGALAKKYQGKHFADSTKAAEYLLSKLQKDDILLVKASRAIKLDQAVEILKEK